jgi:mRNA-degrading endonuclease toxin of MazEF toxin-antitoxin module
VVLEAGRDPVGRLCAVSLDPVLNVPTGALTERLGRLDEARMRQVSDALAVAVACERVG